MTIKHLHIALIAILLSACSSRLPEVETTIHPCASAPESRVAAAYAAVDSVLYLIGGRTEEHMVTSTVLRYNAAKDTWSKTVTPMKPRVNATATTLNGCIYVGLGFDGTSINRNESYLRDFYRFDPSNSSWTRLEDFPSDKTVAAVSFSDGQYVYVGFGYRGFSNELFRYDPASDTWSQVEQPAKGYTPPRVMSPIAATIGQRYLIGTGYHPFVCSFLAEFSPADNSWTERKAVPGKARHNAACASTDDRMFVFGGWHYGDSLTNGFHFEDILCYTPENDSWSCYGIMPDGPSENRFAARVGTRIYFGLGEDNHGKYLRNLYYFESR